MNKRAMLFSLLTGTLLIAVGTLLAQAGLANWSLTLVGTLLIGISLVQRVQPELKPAPVRVDAQHGEH